MEIGKEATMQPNWSEAMRNDPPVNPFLWKALDLDDLRGVQDFEDPCPLDERLEPRD